MRRALVVVPAVLALSLTAVGPAAADSAAGTPTPSSGKSDGTSTFTLTGVPATSGESVVLKLAGHPDLTTTVSNPGAGPLCSVGLSDSDCGSSITVTAATKDAFPGMYDIVRTQTASVSGTTTTLTSPAAFQVRSQPGLTAVAPSSRAQGSSSLVTITGSGFGPAPTVSFGDGITVSDVAYVDAHTLTATVAVPLAAATGARSLTVTSADGLAATKSSALTVSPAPSLDAVSSEPTVLRGGPSAHLTLTGSALTTGGDFQLTAPGLTFSNVSSNGSTLTVDVAAGATAPYGDRTLFLTNSDGGHAQALNAVRVIGPPAAPAAVAAIGLDRAAIVGWTVPADHGSSPITSWTVTPSGGLPPVTVAGSATRATVTGLTNGTSYTFDVAATNSDGGAGPAKTTTPVTPKYFVKLSLLSNRATAVSGQSAVIHGVLTRADGSPLPGRVVSLRAGAVRTLTTDAYGRWSTTVPLTYTTTFVASFAGSADTAAVTAPALTVPVGTRITVTSPASGAVVGLPFAVRGSVSPNKAGKTLGVYKIVNGASSLVGRATIASNGTYAASVRLPVGNYLLKVVLGPTSGNATGTSAQFVVKRR